MVPLIRSNWTGRPSPIEIGAGIPAVLLLVSNSLAGHAAALGVFSWRVVPDVVHLLAVSVWPAGLLFFAFFLSAARDRPATVEIRGVVGRFSNVSFVAVMILLLTGALNARCLVGSFSAFVTTSYGHVLDLKLFLVGSIVLVAAWNRYRIVPAFFRAQPTAPRFLRGFVLIELALALLIVFVVSILGMTPPPK
jgi:putative copper export protein